MIPRLIIFSVEMGAAPTWFLTGSTSRAVRWLARVILSKHWVPSCLTAETPRRPWSGICIYESRSLLLTEDSPPHVYIFSHATVGIFIGLVWPCGHQAQPINQSTSRHLYAHSERYAGLQVLLVLFESSPHKKTTSSASFPLVPILFEV